MKAINNIYVFKQRQYSEAVGCLVGLEHISRLRQFRELRPKTPLRGHARDWWIYALSCHIPNHAC